MSNYFFVPLPTFVNIETLNFLVHPSYSIILTLFTLLCLPISWNKKQENKWKFKNIHITLRQELYYDYIVNFSMIFWNCGCDGVRCLSIYASSASEWYWKKKHSWVSAIVLHPSLHLPLLAVTVLLWRSCSPCSENPLVLTAK